MLIDTHCHLDLVQSNTRLDDVLLRASNNGVEAIINPSIDLESCLEVIRISANHLPVYSTIGIHPNEAGKVHLQDVISVLESRLLSAKVVGIGEIGLDYYHQDTDPSIQHQVFDLQLDLAITHHLPVVLHSRDSIQDVLSHIKNHYSPIKSGILAGYNGVLHAFEGNLEEAMEAIQYGFLIGIGGPLTYNNATIKQSIARALPLESLVLETDAPFLAPVPYRGQQNEPSYIRKVAEKLALIKECDIKQVEIQTTRNACSLFHFGDAIASA